MRARDFVNEDDFGVSPKRPPRPGTRLPREATAKPLYKTIVQPTKNEIELGLAERGKASRALCVSSKPDEALGASMLASCKSQGLRARDGKKSHLIGNKRVTVGGKKIKGKTYGGPLKDYS